MSTVATEVRATRIGIVLALYPTDPSLEMEIQRAPDSSGSPDTGNAEVIALVPAGTRTYADLRSGGTWHYRIRHVRAGATASSWTDWVAATPQAIPAELPQIPDVGGWIIKQGRLESTDGNIVLDAPNEEFRIGSATDPTTGTGVFIGSDGSTGYDLRAGDPSGDNIHWDESASTLNVNGVLRTNGVRFGPDHKDTTLRTVTGTTSETTLETITLTADSLGTNGGVVVRGLFDSNANGGSGNRTIRFRFGGTAFGDATLAAAGSNLTGSFECYVFNDNATGAQVAWMTVWTNLGSSGTVDVQGVTTLTVDTTSDADLVIQGQLIDGTTDLRLAVTSLSYIGSN